ncbi:hypothetical protein [Gordonia westfalica]|uniref:ABC-2 family transporter protein n=1 Tax=Gordonia westfalica TaxID=158898 RepID=A0A1H2JF54_9ACTN|nr:hypothetical protein [Gordonia westfalica]SDU54967.1 hypothetical protein SAMN04488548_1342058 [Gordonia westfalica]
MSSGPPGAATSWPKLLAALAFPIFMALAMPAAYLAAFHEPEPTNMVVQIVGTGDRAQKLATGVGVSTEGRFDAAVVADTETAKRALADLDSRAAYDPETGDLFIASAGGAAAAQAVTAVFTEVAGQSGQTLSVTDVAPLPEQDRVGVSFLFIGLAAILAGFTTATMLGMVLPGLGLRRHLAILGGMSVITAVIGTWIAYGVYGALSTNLLAVGAMLTVLSAVTGLIHLGGLRLIGSEMTVVSVILFIILGIPASGAGVPADMVPGFFGSLQHFLTTSSGLDALRRIIYFDGAGIAADLTTLAIWTVAAIGMFTLATLKRPGKGGEEVLPIAVPTEPAERRLFTRRLTAGVMTLPLLFAIVMPLVFVGLFHSPAPRSMPIAVIGSGAPVTETVAGLEAAAGDALDVVVVPDAGVARQQLEDLELRGAVEPMSGDVYVASAAGMQAAAAVESLLTGVVESGGRTATITDVAPLPAEDSVGASSLYLGIGAAVGGFLAAVIVSVFGGGLRTRVQALVVVAVAVISAAIQVLWGWTVFDIFDGSALSAFGMLTALGITIGLITLAGFKLIGPAQLLITLFVFIIPGVAASGIAVQLDLAPSFYGVLHAILPTAQGLGAIRDVIYFDGAGVGSSLAVMGAWAAAAVICLVWASRRAGKADRSGEETADDQAVETDEGQVLVGAVDAP